MTRQKTTASPDKHSANPTIEMRQIVKAFENAAGKVTVLKGLDLTVNQGEFISIIGKSGSGKSTLLNMITGIDHPSSGHVIIGGTDLYESMDENKRSLWRGRNLGIVFQFFQLFPTLTLHENVMLAMDFANAYEVQGRAKRASELLKMVGLEALQDKLPALVSTGQQQLTAIARALACDPPVMVADEPTGNLDTRSADAIVNLFETLSLQGKTVVIVTHDPALSQRTTRTIILSDGEIISEAISRGLAWLDHSSMLALTKVAKKEQHAASSVVLDDKVDRDTYFLISRGSASISNQGNKPQDIGELHAGDLFGGQEWISVFGRKASVRATADLPLEVIRLNSSDVEGILAGSLQGAALAHQNIRKKIEGYRSSKTSRSDVK